MARSPSIHSGRCRKLLSGGLGNAGIRPGRRLRGRNRALKSALRACKAENGAAAFPAPFPAPIPRVGVLHRFAPMVIAEHEVVDRLQMISVNAPVKIDADRATLRRALPGTLRPALPRHKNSCGRTLPS